MKNAITLLVLTCIVYSLATCVQAVKDESKKETVYLFKTDAESFAMNMSLSGIMWGTGMCGDNKTAIPVHHGDLLYILFPHADETPLIIEYDKKDGIHGKFNAKNAGEYTYLYTMNDSVIQLNLSDESNAWQWLVNAADDDLKTIRSLFFTGEIDACHYTLLEKIAQVNSSPGIFFEDSRQLLHILPVFQPHYLILGECGHVDEGVAEELYSLLKEQKKLKKVYLFFAAKDPVQMYTLLSSLPALQSVVICPSVFNEMTVTSLPESVKNFEELIVYSEDNNEIRDLSIIKDVTNIKKLRFLMTKISGNMEDLFCLPGLTTLSFTGTEVEKFPEIQEMPDIQWFSFPKNTDQAYFHAFLEKNPRIEYLEIAGCNNITDLTPIMHLKRIKGLIIIDTEIEDFSPIHTIKNLEFAILPSELFKENMGTEIEELKKNLPDSEIICGEPFCLGSGWILLFPLIILLCFAFITCLKKYRIHTRKRM